MAWAARAAREARCASTDRRVRRRSPGPWTSKEHIPSLARDDLSACFRYCDVELVAAVEENGYLEQSVRIVRRGSLAPSARSANGVRLAAACKLFDATGAELLSYLVVEDQDGVRASDLLDRHLPTQVFSKLCSGWCEIELSSPGFRRQRLGATIVAGRATPIEVVLEAE